MKKLLLLLITSFIFSCSKDSNDETPLEMGTEMETLIEITTEDFVTNINESQVNQTILGTVVATANEGTLNFNIISQSPEGAVTINTNTGELSIANASIFDYETNKTVTGTISASANDNSKTLNFTINIIDVDDTSITINSPNEFYVNENSVNNTIIGKVMASIDNTSLLIYTIETSSIEGAIVIDPVSGELKINDNSKFDFETLQEITTTVKVTLNGSDKTEIQDIKIIILDIEEPLLVSTFAGSSSGYVDGELSVATFNSPTGVALDNDGNIYVTEYGNHTVRKITPEGMVSTLVGGFNGFKDGTGTDALLFRPSDIIMGNDGFLYVADTYNNKIRKISLNGVVTTLAGSSQGFADGTGTNAKFNRPTGLTMDSNGNIYVTDLENQRIRKVTSTGIVTTIAGGTEGFNNGTGDTAQFKDPTGISINSNNELLVTDRFGRTIRKVTLNGVVTKFAGTTGVSGSFDRTITDSTFGTPNGITIDNDGNILVTDETHNNIRKIAVNLEISTLAGVSNTSVGNSGNTDGIGADARFNKPAGMTVAPNGTIYIADFGNHSIRIIK